MTDCPHWWEGCGCDTPDLSWEDVEWSLYDLDVLPEHKRRGDTAATHISPCPLRVIPRAVHRATVPLVEEASGTAHDFYPETA